MLSYGARSRSGTQVRVRPRLSGGVRYSIPGAEALPTFRGRILYLPLYRNTTLTEYGANVVMSARGSSRGLGFIGSLLSVAGPVVSQAAGFIGSVVGTVVQVVAQILSSIVTFIIDAVMAVVNAVLGAVGGLLGAVLDAVGLMGDGDLTPEKAAELAALLQAKKNTLTGHENDLNRPLTQEERDGYARNLDDAQSGINSMSGTLGRVVNALGGPIGTLAAAAGAAGLIILAKRR